MANSDTVRATWGVGSYVTEKKFVAGVELEIEDVRDIEGNISWQIEADGSLRNNGREFISPPLDRAGLVKGFKNIHASLVHSAKNPSPFSERTSIHVHVNCLDLTQQQTRSIILWYALFEPIFFAMVAPHRRNNIHCVGLDQTVVSEHYRRTLPIFVSKWNKYAALNVLPLKPQGTIEFRHMEGHADADRFADWLLILENLWTYGKDNIFSVKELEKGILPHFDGIFKNTGAYKFRAFAENMCANNLIDVKLGLI